LWWSNGLAISAQRASHRGDRLTSTHPQDRIIKPGIYAEAGIGFYWRLELESRPHLIASTLTHGKFRNTITALSGDATLIPDPFPVEIDPADLTRQLPSRSPATSSSRRRIS